MKKFMIVSKNPQVEEAVKVDLNAATGEISVNGVARIYANYVRSNNRGWTFKTYTFGSSPIEIFYSRGEYMQVPIDKKKAKK